MEIGIITDNLDSGLKAGTQRYTLQLVRNLLAIDRKNHYTLMHGEPSDLDIYHRPNVHEQVIRKPKSQLFKEVFVTPLRLRNSHLDIIHQTAQISPFPLKRKARIVTTIHDLAPIVVPHTHIPLMRFAYKHLLPFCLRNSDAVIAMSENTKRDVVRLCGVPEEKVRVIYGGVEAQYHPCARGEARRIQETHGLAPRYLLYVGTLQPRKNIPMLLRAFALLKRSSGFRDVQLVLAGEKGWMYKEIFDTISSLGIAKDTVPLGFVRDEDLPALYSGASAFVYPSLYEGFGLPPLEAMACGCPVITSNSSSLPEVVGDAGILVDPHDVQAWAGSIARVLSGKALARQMSRKGIARAKKFTWRKCAEETLKLYQELAQKE